MNLWNDEQEKPIKHLRVIDLSTQLTGPYLTRILSQYGADVIKIERLPEGDGLRELSDSKLFDLLNQGKKSIAVDITQKEGKELVKRLASEADILVENSREGVLDKMGLGYGDISEENPELLYVSLRGFHGKNANLAGHDLNFVAASGCGEWFLENPNYSTFFADMVGGVYTPLIKILMHLSNPNRRGMHLVSSMDTGFRSIYLPRAYDRFHDLKGAQDLFDGSKPSSRFYQCRDKQWISLQAVQKKHWDLFCDIIDHKEWKERRLDFGLTKDLEKMFSDAPASYWESLATSRDVCLFRVVPWEEHLSFTQARAELSTDPLTWAGFSSNKTLCPSPKLGQDTYAVAQLVGYDNNQISELLSRAILKAVKI